MLQKFEINSIHTTVNPALKKYVNKKIGGLDRYIPRNYRASAHAEVHLKEIKSSNNNPFCCEVTMFLPSQTIVVKESAINMYAAVDIAEAKLKLQLKKYKDRHGGGKSTRHLVGRLMHKA